MALRVSGTSAYTYHRGDQYDKMTIGNTTIAIYHKSIQSSIHLTLEPNCNFVFLFAPIEAASITIKATNILALGSFHSKTGGTIIHAKNFYGVGVKFEKAAYIKANGDLNIFATPRPGKDVHLFGNCVQLNDLPKQFDKIATEMKTLASQGINDQNGEQFAQAMVKIEQMLSAPAEEASIADETAQPVMY